MFIWIIFDANHSERNYVFLLQFVIVISDQHKHWNLIVKFIYHIQLHLDILQRKNQYMTSFKDPFEYDYAFLILLTLKKSIICVGYFSRPSITGSVVNDTTVCQFDFFENFLSLHIISSEILQFSQIWQHFK